MAIRIDTTRQNLADRYASLGNFLGLATADPGEMAAPAHEASGGSYARVATTWSSEIGGWEKGATCTINANAGTYTFAILCSAATGDNMIDNCSIDSTILSSAGQIVLTPAYVQT
jgi:hypothetical protein